LKVFFQVQKFLKQSLMHQKCHKENFKNTEKI
jgi:hypothetical protein